MHVLTTAPSHVHTYTHARAQHGAVPLVTRCAILRQECLVLERLRQVQARAAVGSARAARAHARGLRLAGGAAALDELLAARHGAVLSTRMRVDELLAARAAVVAEDVAGLVAADVEEEEAVAGLAGVVGQEAVVLVKGGSSAAEGRKASVATLSGCTDDADDADDDDADDADDGSEGPEDTHASDQHGVEDSLDECVTHASDQHGAEDSLDECVTLVSDWLLALVASDVSLMLAIERVWEARGTDKAAGGDKAARSGAHAQPIDDLLAPGVVVLADGCRFCYRLAVVDTRPKPTRKVKEHAELDATIVAHWTARGGPPARRCSM